MPAGDESAVRAVEIRRRAAAVAVQGAICAAATGVGTKRAEEWSLGQNGEGSIGERREGYHCGCGWTAGIDIEGSN